MGYRKGRRGVHRWWRWAPAAGLVVWAINVYRVANEYAMPAFGAVDEHVAHYGLTLLKHLPVGVALVCLTAVSLLRSRVRPSNHRRRVGNESHRRRRSVRSVE